MVFLTSEAWRDVSELMTYPLVVLLDDSGWVCTLYLDPSSQNSNLDLLHSPESIIRMVHIVKLLSGIGASDTHEHFPTTRVVLEELGHIVNCSRSIFDPGFSGSEGQCNEFILPFP